MSDKDTITLPRELVLHLEAMLVCFSVTQSHRDQRNAREAITAVRAHLAAPRLCDLRRNAERYRRLLKWLIVTGLLSRERCRIDSPASYGDWWILRKPKVIEAGFVGYGETEGAAIDAATEPATEPAIRARGEVPK